jgi:membrane protein YdbS with pleckstrin-like domain
MTEEPRPPDVNPFADWQPLAPAAVRWHVWWSLALLPLPALAWLFARVFVRALDPTLAAAAAGALFALCALNVVRTIVWTRRFRFRLTATTAETSARFLTQTTRMVPLGRIQHVDVTAGPIQRALEIASVAAHTAAGESTIVLPGLSAGTAELVREHLLRERRREAV